jgi:hypothetical protein
VSFDPVRGSSKKGSKEREKPHTQNRRMRHPNRFCATRRRTLDRGCTGRVWSAKNQGEWIGALLLEVAMKASNWALIILPLFPQLIAAQKPDTSATPHEAQILWEFNTGG